MPVGTTHYAIMISLSEKVLKNAILIVIMG